MEQPNTYLRVARLDDAENLLKIYAPYVKKTAITFEYEVPTVAEFRKRMKKTLSRYPYLVAVKDSNIVGYAYTSAFVGRAAYDWSAETTIYLQEDQHKTGIGRLLYQALEDISSVQHILNLNACIGYPEVEDAYLTKNSAQFHTRLGYTLVGKFHKCGYKFGQWYNMIWMEKLLDKHPARPLPLIPFSAIDIATLQSLGIRHA